MPQKEEGPLSNSVISNSGSSYNINNQRSISSGEKGTAGGPKRNARGSGSSKEK